MIEGYNRDHKKRLPVDEMKWFYKKWLEIGSFKETVKFYNYSKATQYRYLKRFKKVGISEHNVRPVTEYSVPAAVTDLGAYHWAIMTDYRIKNRNILAFY